MLLDTVHDGAFGDLEFETLGFEIVVGECFADGRQQAAMAQLHRGEIDGDG